MTPINPNTFSRSVPPLADLLTSYLSTRGVISEVPTGEVEPFEVAAGLRCDPQTAWADALTAIRLQQPQAGTVPISAPSEWANLVLTQDAVAALPFAAGQFPQQVRDLTPLLQAAKLSDLRPAEAPQSPSGTVGNWAFETARQHGMPTTLVAAGVLRLARETAAAGRLLTEAKATCPPEWRIALANEEAASDWQEGRWQEAADRWLTLPVSVPVLFNRGLADLFLDRPTQARSSFQQAVDRLPEGDGWHHLARLYLALAEMRGPKRFMPNG